MYNTQKDKQVKLARDSRPCTYLSFQRVQRYNNFSNRQNSKGLHTAEKRKRRYRNDFIDTLEEVVFNVKTASFSFVLPFIGGTQSQYTPKIGAFAATSFLICSFS